jgi:hypothetical protein
MDEAEGNIVRQFQQACLMLLFLIHFRVMMLRRLLAYQHIMEAKRLLEGES